MYHVTSRHYVHLQVIPVKHWTCGYCGVLVASDRGYQICTSENPNDGGFLGGIYICPNCQAPSYLASAVHDRMLPAAPFGNAVLHLPKEIKELYDEARQCTGHEAYTAAAMLCRKLLMNVAVSRGAPKNGSFKSYVDYLEANSYVPPGCKGWVDVIKNTGKALAKGARGIGF